MRRGHLRFLALVLLPLLTTGCGGLSSSTTTTGAVSSTEAPSTSTSEATVTTAAATTTTMATTTVLLAYPVDPTDLIPDVFPGVTNGAHGSGCVTPGFDELPDGVWFGFIETVSSSMVTFDLACFFTGEAACVAQTEDGAAAGPADCLDLWIRNHVETPFGVPISPEARVWYVDALAPEWDNTFEIPLASWPTEASYQPCASDYCAAWLYVNDGRATGIVEQYLP
mgnify:CR=1 FL=1